MAEAKQPDIIGVSKPDKIKLNILSTGGKNIKIKVKLNWTILQLKEHLYDHNYFRQAASTQIISFQGADLKNSQTFEQIYDALKNKGSKGVLRSLRGQLTWEDASNLNPNDLAKEPQSPQNDDNDDIPKLNLEDDSVAEISLYIRFKEAPKVCITHIDILYLFDLTSFHFVHIATYQSTEEINDIDLG